MYKKCAGIAHKAITSTRTLFFNKRTKLSNEFHFNILKLNRFMQIIWEYNS